MARDSSAAGCERLSRRMLPGEVCGAAISTMWRRSLASRAWASPCRTTAQSGQRWKINGLADGLAEVCTERLFLESVETRDGDTQVGFCKPWLLCFFVWSVMGQGVTRVTDSGGLRA